MLTNGMLENFPLPEGALEAFKKQNYQSNSLGDGVDMFMAHDKGLSYRFYICPVKNEVKSKIAKYEIFDEIHMIEWFIDRKNKICERVRLLPEELLKFDEDGMCISGLYMKAYQNFLEGKNTPGLPLSKWGVLSDGDVATLASAGIFSVEQLAAQPKNKFAGKYHAEIIEGYERAIQHVSSKDARADATTHINELVKLQQELSKKDDALATLQEQMKNLLSGNIDIKQRGRPKKITEEE